MELDSDEEDSIKASSHQSTKETVTTTTATTIDANTTTITPTQRIAELNSIDSSIATLLTSASTATAILANQGGSSSSNSSNGNLSAAQADFTSAAQTYFSTLSSIEVRLRRQVYALEEAGLIRAGDERDARRGRILNSEDGTVRRGGGEGPLDPSWLNARISDGVEVGKKRELLDQAKALLERMRNAQ